MERETTYVDVDVACRAAEAARRQRRVLFEGTASQERVRWTLLALQAMALVWLFVSWSAWHWRGTPCGLAACLAAVATATLVMSQPRLIVRVDHVLDAFDEFEAARDAALTEVEWFRRSNEALQRHGQRLVILRWLTVVGLWSLAVATIVDRWT